MGVLQLIWLCETGGGGGGGGGGYVTDVPKYHNAGIWSMDYKILRFMFNIYSSSSSLVITSHCFATSRLVAPVWGAVCFRSSWERAVTDVRDGPLRWTFETNGTDSWRRLFQKSVRAGRGGGPWTDVRDGPLGWTFETNGAPYARVCETGLLRCYGGHVTLRHVGKTIDMIKKKADQNRVHILEYNVTMGIPPLCHGKCYWVQ